MAQFFSSDHNEISKYQNRRISAFQKLLGKAIFFIFWIRQRKIICYSCFWSHCIDIDKAILKNHDIVIDIYKDNLENIYININKDYLENIDIDKDILENIDIEFKGHVG